MVQPNFALLLDKSSPFNENKIALLDQLTEGMNSNNPQLINIANKVLTELKTDGDFWQYCDMILENSKSIHSKFFALLALEEAINTRWKIFPENQKEAIKKYMVSLVIKLGSNQINDKLVQVFLNKANSLLISIVKNEWSNTWLTFIPEIVGSSKTNQNLCENNLNLLKYLSEEIFDYSKNKLTSDQIKELKSKLTNEFGSIYELCHTILKSHFEQQVKGSLVAACLKTLLAFLSWIPLGYIFLTDLLEILLKFVDTAAYRSLAIRCLAEIASLGIEDLQGDDAAKIKQKAFQMFTTFLFKLSNIIPAEVPLSIERAKLVGQQGNNLPMFDNLCQILALFFTGFFKTHLGWIEPLADNPENPEQTMTIEVIKKGFDYLVNLTDLAEDQCWKICAEFWHDFTNELIKRQTQNMGGQNGFSMNNEPLLILNVQKPTLKTFVYNPAFVQVRKVLITRMAKPFEVLIVIDETGIPVKEQLENTENTSMYEILKQLMINLAKLDWDNTKTIMEAKLERQMDGTEWSFDNLNSLCWAIGSISGTLPEADEKIFLISIIRTLLNLTEKKKGKENKAVVASNIMYICGQYPRFLRSNWNFLKTVVKKLFEFMHESYPGIMEMACNTFLKITLTCKSEFVIVHLKTDDSKTYESEPFINELIRKIPEEIDMLETPHRLIFYEAVGHIISAEQDPNTRKYLLEGLFAELWAAWESIIKEASHNMDVLKDEKYIDQISYILKIHERVAFGVGHFFYLCLAKIYLDMLKLYIFYSELISNEVKNNGKHILQWTIVKKMRGVRKNILGLITTYMEKTEDPHLVAENFVLPVLQILKDYCNNIPEAREADVLILFSTIIRKLSFAITAAIPQILELTFAANIQMISTDFNSFPDHRVNFFEFLKAVVSNCFTALFNIPPDQFRTVIDCIIWAFKHDHPNISMMGLDTLIVVLRNVNLDANVANQFYAIYYMQLIQDLMYILTDSLHKSGFKQQSQILALMFEVVDKGLLTTPLYNTMQNPGISNNKEYVYNAVVNLLSNSFPTVSKQQTGQHVLRFFQTSGNLHDFKIALSDYLVNLSQFSNDMEALGINTPSNKNNQNTMG